MSAEAILFVVSCGLLNLVAVLWCRVRRLSALCRQVAMHMNIENTVTIRDPDTHVKLISECERAGWTKKACLSG